MAPLLDLDPDQLLSTTRAVRKRLDFDRPVELEVLRDCVEVATQAPTGSNQQGWHFVLVTDEAKRVALGEIYRKAFALYLGSGMAAGATPTGDAALDATNQRVLSSADYLAEHLHRSPAMLIPCVTGKVDGMPNLGSSSILGSVIPAAWSFCLAARARGLGTSWTTLHLMFEEEAADVVGIPFAEVSQVALIPVAYTKGTDFKPAPRIALDNVLHVDTW